MAVCSTETMASANLVITNFSGGKRHSLSPKVGSNGVEQVALLADSLSTGPAVVLAIQEMTTNDPGLPTRAIALEEQLGRRARSSFVPRVSTAWYPLVEKWGPAVGSSGAHNEGLCVATRDGALKLAPWGLLDGPTSVVSPTRVLDLPAFEFPDQSVNMIDESDWIRSPVVFRGVAMELLFRPAYYRGSRDSDPRVAQACLLAWSPASDSDKLMPACVLVNVHLSTLNREKVDESSARVPSAEASFLRNLQLRVVARYVREVQDTYELPVVVAGDFNAEPDSPEMLGFAEESGLWARVRADVCWKCGFRQEVRPKVAFYDLGGAGLELTMVPQPSKDPVFCTDAVCCNELCREPRFTHKGNLQLLDNVFVPQHRADRPRVVVAGTPQIDLTWEYSDHAAIIVPLSIHV